MVHSKCPSTEPGYCNDISSIKFTAFDLYLSVQSQDGRCKCRSCRRRLWWVFVVEPKYHRKRTWASTNFWDSTSSSQDCFILLIFILIAKLLCTHESSICIYIFRNSFLDSRKHFSNIKFTHVHRWQALVIPSERRTGVVLWIHGSRWRVNRNTGFQNKTSFSSWGSGFMFQTSWNISRVF